jgi:hypothetical protein
MGFIQSRGGVGFAALCRKAGLPSAMIPAFAAAAAAWQELGVAGDGRLSRVMIEAVLSAVTLIEGPEMGKVRALLLGYQAEAMRAEARLRIDDILAQDDAEETFIDDASANLMPHAADDLEDLLTGALEQEFRAAA